MQRIDGHLSVVIESLQGTPLAASYNSHSLLAAAARNHHAASQQGPVGSLETLRAATWQHPHGPAFQNGAAIGQQQPMSYLAR